MYDDLIKRLHKRIALTTAGSPLQDDLEEAADAIETMCEMVATAHGELANVIQNYEESKPRWIPVTEQLPEKRKWVLCRCEANIIEVLRWENNEWFHDPMHVYYPSFVTHWMPLPEPPKEET